MHGSVSIKCNVVTVADGLHAVTLGHSCTLHYIGNIVLIYMFIF